MILWQAHLSFTLLAFLLLARARYSTGQKLAMLALGFVAATLPLKGMTLAVHVRSFTDDLAISSLVLLSWMAAQRFGLAAPHAAGQLPSLALFALMALLLYPATLGLSYFDPYRYGYDPQWLLPLAGLCALVCLYRRDWLGVAMLVLPTLAFALHLKASSNYWDYLLDPLLVLYCWGWLVRAGLRRSYPQTGASQ